MFSVFRYIILLALWPLGALMAILYLVAESKGDVTGRDKAGAVFLSLSGVANRIEPYSAAPAPIDLSKDERFGGSE